jgi:hypothetical protein
MDGVMKLVKPEPVVKTTVQVAYPESIILGLGIVLLLLGEMLNDEAELHEYANSKRLSETHSSQYSDRCEAESKGPVQIATPHRAGKHSRVRCSALAGSAFIRRHKYWGLLLSRKGAATPLCLAGSPSDEPGSLGA